MLLIMQELFLIRYAEIAWGVLLIWIFLSRSYWHNVHTVQEYIHIIYLYLYRIFIQCGRCCKLKFFFFCLSAFRLPSLLFCPKIKGTLITEQEYIFLHIRVSYVWKKNSTVALSCDSMPASFYVWSRLIELQIIVQEYIFVYG